MTPAPIMALSSGLTEGRRGPRSTTVTPSYTPIYTPYNSKGTPTWPLLPMTQATPWRTNSGVYTVSAGAHAHSFPEEEFLARHVCDAPLRMRFMNSLAGVAAARANLLTNYIKNGLFVTSFASLYCVCNSQPAWGGIRDGREEHDFGWESVSWRYRKAGGERDTDQMVRVGEGVLSHGHPRWLYAAPVQGESLDLFKGLRGTGPLLNHQYQTTKVPFY